MKIPIYQFDAFTGKESAGNPAAVCPLDDWLEEGAMQEIAAENGLSETAFFVSDGDGFALRWFTPTTEMDLCGHATLASAFVICTQLDPDRREAVFQTKSGQLSVVKTDSMFVMDFPARPPNPVSPPAGLIKALGGSPTEVLLAARDYLVVYKSERDIRNLNPDIPALSKFDHPVIVTAPGIGFDCVSRFFAPTMGISEDPATGSAHCTIAPYWAKRLGKQTVHAYQASARGGELKCECIGDRVHVAGSCALQTKTELEVPATN